MPLRCSGGQGSIWATPYPTIERRAVSSEERVMQSPLRCLILISALSVIASAGCDAGAPGRDLGNNRSVTRQDAYKGQVALDVTAIVAGMTRAHGAQAVALLPKWWQDFLSQP